MARPVALSRDRPPGPFSSGNLMQRKILLGIVVAVSLSLPAVAFAASVHRKPLVIHPWHGYGFCPAIISRPATASPFMVRRERSATQSMLQDTGMTVGSIISAVLDFPVDATTAAASDRAGPIHLSD
jgi:hypothetical protein